MEMKHMIQIIFTILVIYIICSIIIRVRKKNHKETYMYEGMILGFVIGAISSYYVKNALIYTPIGMFLGIEIGKNIKRTRGINKAKNK